MINPNTFSLLLLVGIIPIAIGLNVEVMEVDAAQYSTISMELLENGDLLHFTDQGEEYLDKPPLHLWLGALSYSFFGISNIAYKLPSFLFFLMSLWALYRLCLLVKDERLARISSLVYLTMAGSVLILNDVRTDSLFISTSLISVSFLMYYLEKGKFYDQILFAVFTGLAMLTKGPLGLIIPATFGFYYLLVTKRWRILFKPGWALVIFIIALLLLPMCYGLYKQFGLKGIEFYFWEQSFGRITGENEWKNDAGPLYLFQNLLWATLPWLIMIVLGFYSIFRREVNSNLLRPLILSSATILLALSLSKYQLPHYIFVLLPYLSIIAAIGIMSSIRSYYKIGIVFHRILLIGMVIITLILNLYSFYSVRVWMLTFISLIVLTTFYLLKRSLRIQFPNMFGWTFLIAANIWLWNNLNFYPELLTYQFQSQLGRFYIDNELPPEKLYKCYAWGRSIDHKIGVIIPNLSSAAQLIQYAREEGTIYASVNETIINDLSRSKVEYKILQSFNGVNVTRLKLSYLIPEQRKNKLTVSYLIMITN